MKCTKCNQKVKVNQQIDGVCLDCVTDSTINKIRDDIQKESRGDDGNSTPKASVSGIVPSCKPQTLPSEKDKELERKIDFLNPQSGIHKGHWTYEDVCQAELKGRQEARKEVIEEVEKIIGELMGHAFYYHGDEVLDNLKERLLLLKEEKKQ